MGPYLGADMQSPVIPSDPFSSPVQYLRGIGPKKSAVLAQFGIRTVHDLLLHVPRRYLDRTAIVTMAALRAIASRPAAGTPPEGENAPRQEYTVVGEVRSFRLLGAGKKSRFVLVLADATGSLQCIWFGGVHYWKQMFRIGETLAVSGQPSFYGTILQLIHPDIDRITPPAEEGEADPSGTRWLNTLHTGGLVPLYPSGQELVRVGLDSGGFRRVIDAALRSHGDALPEILPASIISVHNLVPVSQALKSVHFPREQEELQNGLKRLKYEELFLFQLKLALRRQRTKTDNDGISFSPNSRFARDLVDSLRFSLTRAQIRVINEVTRDMESPRPMNRLLQGDVGSGKTIVALIAMLIAVENGYQAAFMVPTELLAEQHFATLSHLLRGLPVSIRLLVGAQKSAPRRRVLGEISSGAASIVVGTHALFEKDVQFARLGFVTIDEQHRFGVMQRASLRGKGSNPDVLVMTATPIPRTLSLTLYGDLDVSGKSVV